MTVLTAPVPAHAAHASLPTPLHPSTIQRVRATRLGFSLDWWSVIVAILLAAFTWAGLVPTIGW